jgi:hypothetical protein
LTREDPGGDPPSAATSAQAVDAGRVHELRAARDLALTNAQELVELLATEEALVAKLAELHAEVEDQFEAHRKDLVGLDLAGQPVTRESLIEQGRELGRKRDLARELISRQLQAEGTARALAQVESRAAVGAGAGAGNGARANPGAGTGAGAGAGAVAQG